MVLKIKNLSQWAPLTDSGLELPPGKGRTVRVELNCPKPTRFDVVINDDHYFLAAGIVGYEVVEFFAPHGAENIALVWFGDEAPWYRTFDGETFAINKPEAVTFTTLWERAARDPVREALMWEARQNALRLQASLDAQRDQMNADMTAFRAEMEAAKAAAAPAPAPEPEGDESPAPAPAGADQTATSGDGGSVQQVASVSPAQTKAKGAKANATA